CTQTCGPGWFCPSGTAAPIACDRGRYSSVFALSTSEGCLPAPAGYSVPLPNSSLPTPCPPGRFGSNPLSSSPSCDGPCWAGWFCPAASTSPQQLPCPAGFFSTSEASGCETCSGGKFANQSAYASCRGCSA